VDHPRLLAEDADVKSQWQTNVDGHAGERETSQILAIHPELVHLDRVALNDEGMPQARLQNLANAGVYTGIWWYADHPTHYRGDARTANADKGLRYQDAQARAIAAAVRLIKMDTTAARLQDEFYDAIDSE
jgi:creatinine amidohydrolase